LLIHSPTLLRVIFTARAISAIFPARIIAPQDSRPLHFPPRRRSRIPQLLDLLTLLRRSEETILRGYVLLKRYTSSPAAVHLEPKWSRCKPGRDAASP
jgi:hypothetical protein